MQQGVKSDMSKLKILTEEQLRQIVKLDSDAIDCIESAFASLASGKVVMPPILSMAIEDYNGEVDVKTAYVPGFDSFAIKMSPGFFDNPKLGLPSTSGLMVLFSAKTGMVEAVLLDNGYLTDVRTAAAGAVAASYLAPAKVRHAAIVGAGSQAYYQLEALCLVRPIESATIWTRDFEKATAAANQLNSKIGISVLPTNDLEQMVRSAEIVVTTTPTAQPLVMSEWLSPGQHITAMGSDQSHKNELHPTCISKADVYVADRQAQTEKVGELHHAIAAGLIASDTKVPELGDIVVGKSKGRTHSGQITICDLTGTGVQDTAIATFAAKRAETNSTSMEIEI